jgi:hypothetical protein
MISVPRGVTSSSFSFSDHFLSGTIAEIVEYRGVMRVPRRVFERLLPERPTERCVEAYRLQRTRFEGSAERKRRQQQLTEGGNV